MASSKMVHRLATHPADYLRFQLSGRLPDTVKPSGPLVALMKRLSPRDVGRLIGVTVGPRLGYASSRQFHYGLQALSWIAPEGEHFAADWPAESWRNKRFQGPLYLEDLLESCSSYPEDLPSRYPQLCRPGPRPGL